MIRTRIAVLLTALVSLIALAQGPGDPPPCAVVATAVIHTYDGPITIDQLCLTVARHTGNAFQFEARDMGEGIFRDGFDGNNP